MYVNLFQGTGSIWSVGDLQQLDGSLRSAEGRGVQSHTYHHRVVISMGMGDGGCIMEEEEDIS